MKKYLYDENYFEKIDTEEKAYWLGFLYADGCVNVHYRNEKVKSMNLELTLCEKDVLHINKFLKSLQSNVPIKQKNIKLSEKQYIAYRVSINSTKICRDLIKCGCVPQKSLILKFPTNDILPRNLIKHFIRGYIDGDGCIYFKRTEKNLFCKINIVGTLDMLNAMQDYFLSENIPSNGTYSKKGNAFEIFIHGEDVLIQIYNHIYKDSIIFLDRKKEKFENMIKEIWKRNPNWSGKHGVSYKKSMNRWVVSYCPDYFKNHQSKNKYFKNLEDAKNFRIKFEIEKIINNKKLPA